MNIFDYKYLVQNIDKDSLLGSDCSIANLFLLQPKYNIKLEIKDNFLYRQYFGEKNRFGYGFPLKLKKNSEKNGENQEINNQNDNNLKENNLKENNLKTAVNYILENNKDFDKISFCLCTQDQKNLLDECFRENFPKYKIDWKTDRNDSDYIYLQEKLSVLSGSALQKKKNHISRFKKTYDGRWEIKFFPQEDLKKDIFEVEEKWFFERSDDIEKSFDNESLLMEKESIYKALENAESFGLKGCVIYIDNEPVAMCVASEISNDCLDVHFEKVINSVAQNGGYAAINNFFVKQCSDYKYINREEDVGVEGLRKAKLSYKPEILLDKFYGQVVKC